MSDYELPVAEAHLKALEARKKLLDALLAGPKPQTPKELAFQEGSACDQLYNTALQYYIAGSEAFDGGDSGAGYFYFALGSTYLHTAQMCEVATVGSTDNEGSCG
ncbi:MAG TPA: hypothetical protein VFP34_17935, partial [Microlunatus sp.]|nr:hypothetical protein [Microlunatus sp.]